MTFAPVTTSQLASLLESMDDGTDAAADRITKTILSEHDDMAYDLLRPVVRSQVIARRRRESRVIAPPDRKAAQTREPVLDRPPVDVLLERRKLLAETFLDPLTSTRVSWGKATVEQHRARAELLRGNADMALRVAAEHDLAAAEIVRAGVRCLEDVRPALAS